MIAVAYSDFLKWTKYQGVKKFTRWLIHITWAFSPHIHLAWAFSPCVHLMWGIRCTRGDFEGVYIELSPPPHKVTSNGHSHLVWALSPCIHLVWAFSPHIHFVWAFSPCVHLVWGTRWLWECACWVVPSTTQSCFNLTWHAPLHAKIISFNSCGKIPKNSQSNPNFINQVHLTSHQKIT